MADKYTIEIRLIGDNITPNKFSSRDIGELISAIEQMLAPIIARDNPALGIEDSEVVVGLALIQHGSYILQFQTPYEEEALKAYDKVTVSIATQKYAALPAKSIEALKIVRKIARKHNTEAQFWKKNGAYEQLATLSTNTRIDAEIPTIQGKTTLYGTVISVGGEDPPRVKLRLINSMAMICRVTRRDGLKVARELGQHLYSVVGVRGTAIWDVRDMTLLDFHVEELTPYRQTSIENAIESLYKIAGKDYEDVDDIDMVIAEIRGSDEDL